ncbi:MAG: hypothetical protein HA491_01755 [Candidatus Verstraetearchaeota archaeon]|nr:hypothetical protein [Candidatus Verstraetearchaeota archaeon]
MVIVIVVNLFGDVSLENLVKSMSRIKTIPQPTYMVLSWSNPPSNAFTMIHSLEERLADRFPITYLPLPKMGSGKQRDLTLKIVLRKFANARYIVYIEDDVVIEEDDWLARLLRVIEKLPQKVAALSLEPGARLYTDFVVTRIATDKELYVGLTGGSGVYITRPSALRELVRLCLGTYSSFMYFHWEDMEFVIKLWLRGYVTVSYRGIKLTHFGCTSQQKPLYRRYTEYLGPVIAVLVNVPSRFLVIGLPLRALRDFVKSMTRNEIVLLLRAYFFVLRNLKHIMVHRFFRFKKYRAQSVFAKILCNRIK